jgi:dephospho-CoA kinase
MSTERRRRAASGDGLVIVGLVGRAGSGKSTVARSFAQAGVPVIDADRLGHEVTDTDPGVRAALREEYGDDVYREDGSLDRSRVGAKVFSDAAARARLNALVHPRILQLIRRRLEEIVARAYRGVVVVDAALMLDWGFERECDVVLAVTAPESEQVSRLVSSRGWTPEAARARLAAQRTNDAFAAAADRVIANSGTPAALETAAREELGRLRSR